VKSYITYPYELVQSCESTLSKYLQKRNLYPIPDAKTRRHAMLEASGAYIRCSENTVI